MPTMTNMDSLTYRLTITVLIISQFNFKIQNKFRCQSFTFISEMMFSLCSLCLSMAYLRPMRVIMLTQVEEKNRKQNSEYCELLWTVISYPLITAISVGITVKHWSFWNKDHIYIVNVVEIRKKWLERCSVFNVRFMSFQ